MTQEQFEALIEYIDKAINASRHQATAGGRETADLWKKAACDTLRDALVN